MNKPKGPKRDKDGGSSRPRKELVGWKCQKCGQYFRRYGLEASQHQMICQPEIYHPWEVGKQTKQDQPR